MRTTLWYSPSPIRARPHPPTFCTGGHDWEFPYRTTLVRKRPFLSNSNRFPRKPEGGSRALLCHRDSRRPLLRLPGVRRNILGIPLQSDGSTPPPLPIPRSPAPASTGIADAVRSAVPTALPWPHGRVEFVQQLRHRRFRHGIDQRQPSRQQ
jgi:hypothetical protein